MQLFNISTLGVDTRLKTSRPAINHSLNHFIRHLVPSLLDGLLQRLDCFVGFRARDRLDVAPNCVVQRIKVRAVRRPLGDGDERRNVFSKPTLSLLGLVARGRILLIHPLNIILFGFLVPPERFFSPWDEMLLQNFDIILLVDLDTFVDEHQWSFSSMGYEPHDHD